MELTIGSERTQQADSQAAAGPHVQHPRGRAQLHQGGEAPQHGQGHGRWLCVEEEQCFLQGILQVTSTGEGALPPPSPLPTTADAPLTCPRAGPPAPSSRGYLCRMAGSQLLARSRRKPSAQSAPAA